MSEPERHTPALIEVEQRRNAELVRSKRSEKAQALAERYASLHSAKSSSIDWGKWGSIAGIIALPLGILLWWFS